MITRNFISIPDKKIKKWWEKTAEDYQKSSTIPTDSAHYGPYAPNEDELNLLGSIKGKKILELGCGGGQCSIAFAKKGAEVTAVDISESQLNYAKELAKDNNVNIEFIQSDFQNLKPLKSKTFDIVFSSYALQYASDLSKVFSETNRVLKSGGLFVFSFDHPFYLIINHKTRKVEQSYFDTGRKEVKMTWKHGKGLSHVYYQYKISDLFNTLIEQGFSVEKILEPLSFKNQKAWTKGVWKEIYPKSTAKMVPPVVIFKTTKK